MGRFIIQRILWMFLVLAVVSLITFTLMHAVPGGPFTQEKRLPAATLEQLNAKYNLDAPLYVQYLDYVGDIAIPVVTTGKQSAYLDHQYLVNISLPFGDKATLRWMNFGPSYKSVSRTVSDIFRDNLPVSIKLGAAALLVTVLVGFPLGVVSALKRNTIVDYIAIGVAVVGVSVPVIILAPALQYGLGVELGWLPVSGWGDLKHLILPAIALGIADAAIIARLTRASLLQVLNQDYIRTARAKGLPRSMVIFVHALKNASLPVVTVIGLDLPFLLAGAIVTERIFAWPGMGRLFLDHVGRGDTPVVMGILMLIAVAVVVFQLLTDVAYAWLDPRIRYN